MQYILDDEKKRIIYEEFGFIDRVKRTIYKGKESKNSLCFDVNKSLDLMEIFEPQNKDLFEKNFDLATHGEGNEINRITTLHSSSLCALLCFYNIEEKNLEMMLNGKKFTAKHVYFEWENKVFNRNSSVDVVLFGECENEKAVLFLESKYSEYTNPGVTHPSEQYLTEYSKFYNKEVFKEIGLSFDEKIKDVTSEDNKGNKVIKRAFSIGYRNKMYAEGIKQMASHYIGINKLINEDSTIQKESQKQLWDEYKNGRIFLGEILFKFSNPKISHYFDNYSDLYKKSCNKFALLEKKQSNKSIEVLDNVLSYQEVFKRYDLDENVRKFYRL